MIKYSCLRICNVDVQNFDWKSIFQYESNGHRTKTENQTAPHKTTNNTPPHSDDEEKKLRSVSPDLQR